MCATGDADVMVSRDYTNAQFASDYLSVYDQNPEVYESVYEALLGKQGFDVFDDYAANSENAVFIGADEKYSGIDTPNFDIVRYLNSKDIDNISYDTVFL